MHKIPQNEAVQHLDTKELKQSLNNSLKITYPNQCLAALVMALPYKHHCIHRLLPPTDNLNFTRFFDQ